MAYDQFIKCAKQVKSLNLVNAAFVSSNAENSYGPWPVNEGLCTLEMHRDLPIDVQVRHLYATSLIDDVIIANAYATEEEMKSVAQCKTGMLAFKVDFEYDLSDVEKELLYEHLHFVRGDMSGYMARSTQPRITYKDADIKPQNTRDLKRGDVIIVNNEYSRYKGELHIVLEDMPNDGRKNVVGSIPQNEMMLMEFLQPWRTFGFVK